MFKAFWEKVRPSLSVWWKANKTGLVSFNGNKVIRTASGTVKLTATYQGQDFVMTIY